MYEKEVKEVAENFLAWLKISKLDERTFIHYRTVKHFKLVWRYDQTKKYRVAAMIYNDNNMILRIGEPISYSVGNEEGFLDVSLLLLYIANIWDKENDKLFNSKERKNYFYDVVSKAISEEDYVLKNKCMEGYM